MRDSWRSGVAEKDKTELITGGVYRISRNPAFLGFDLVYLGLLLSFFSWWLAALTAFAVIALHVQITHVEELFLRTAFGEDYHRYEQQVRRYFGRR
jgi:protein-S-isoprenylcysteine O-methyltransferase Ste14